MVHKLLTDSNANLITCCIDTFTVSDVQFIESGKVIVNESHSVYSSTLPRSSPPRERDEKHCQLIYSKVVVAMMERRWAGAIQTLITCFPELYFNISLPPAPQSSM